MISPSPRRFSYRQTLIIGVGFMGINIVWPVFNRFVPLFLQAGRADFDSGVAVPLAGFALSAPLAFFIMTWDNIINVFVQPIVGMRSDHTWNRFGRRKPWIIVGAPIAMVGFILVPFAQTLLGIVVFIFVTNLGMALFRSPAVAWLGDLFHPEERSRANGILNVMGGLGFVLAQFGGGYVFDRFGRTAPFVGGAIVVTLACLFILWQVQESERLPYAPAPSSDSFGDNLRILWRDPDRSALFVLAGILLWFVGWEALDTGLSSFAVATLGLAPGYAAQLTAAGGAAFLLAAIPAGALGTRLGRKRTIQLGLVGIMVVFGTGSVLIVNATTFVIVLVFGGTFWAFININSLPLVYDYGDEAKIGAFTGLYYFASQSAAVIGPNSGGLAVSAAGNEYRLLFVISALFMGLAYLALMRVGRRSRRLTRVG